MRKLLPLVILALVAVACADDVPPGAALVRTTSPDGAAVVVLEAVPAGEETPPVLAFRVASPPTEEPVVHTTIEVAGLPAAGACRPFWRNPSVIEMICTIDGRDHLFVIDIG